MARAGEWDMKTDDVTQAQASSAGGDGFWDGAKLCIPVIVSSAPFGALFGALAVQNGLTPFDASFMSATVYGGASQMVGIDLFGKHIAPWLIVLSIFAVNFRHVLYSAVIGKRIADWELWQKAIGFFLLTDPQFALSEARAETGRKVNFAWYIGLALPMPFAWVLSTWLGAAFGSLVPNPQALGLDFLLPIYFLGIVMSFRKRPLWLPIVLVSAAASMLAYKFIGSPWHVTVGAVAGVIVGAIFGVADGRIETEEGEP